MSKVDAAHPSAQQLARYGLGQLDKAAAAEIAAHLKTCPKCRQVLAVQPRQGGAVAPQSETIGYIPAPETTAAEPPGLAMAASAGPQRLPERFGRYTIKKMLGQGGMGAVYLAHDTQLDREVGLKVPRIFADDHPDVLQRFYREARAAATFNHPHLCPVYEVGAEGGIHYLTMPFINGQSLAKYLGKTGPLPLRQAAALVRKLALAMQEAHAKGVIHRDLKPGNIMLNKRGEPIIMDFGLARRDQAADSRLTHSGAVMGTPAYMPPEQVSGDQQAIGPCTDIYSMGVILYELLTGRLPFQGSPALQMGLVMTKEPDRPSLLRPDLDGQLEAICLQAMKKKPADRYPSMKAFADDLTSYLKAKAPSTGGPAQARDVDGPALLELGDDSQQRAFTSAVPWSGSWRRIPRTWLITAGVALPLLILAGIVIIIQSRDGAKIRIETSDANTKILEGAGPETTVTPAKADAQGFVPLFNGKDLTGWKKYFTENQVWDVENGVLFGRNRGAPKSGGSFLATERTDYTDFHLRCETRLANGLSALLLFRLQPSTDGGVATGYGAYIPGTEDPKPPVPAGSLCFYRHRMPHRLFERAAKGERLRGDWFTLEVIARGTTLKVLVNGTVVSEDIDDKHTSGAIGLHCRTERSSVWFRKVEIKELPPGDGAAAAPVASPSDALRAGRLQAPDLSKATIMYSDEFDDPKSGFPVAPMADVTRGYQVGKYFIRRSRTGGSWTPGPWKHVGDCACLCVGRVLGGAENLWGMEFNNESRQRGVGVYLSARGELRLHPTYTKGLGHFPPPYRDDIPHAAIKSGEQLNTLLAVVRGRTVEVYVNGVAVCEPMTVDYDFLPCSLDLFGGTQGSGEAVFERLTLYSAGGLPTLAERLKELPVTK